MVRVTKRNSTKSATPQRKPLLFSVLVSAVVLVCVIILQEDEPDASLRLLTTTTDEAANVNQEIGTNGVTTTTISTTTDSTSAPQDFFPIAQKHGTDKVAGAVFLEQCVKNDQNCKPNMKDAANEKCRPWGHFYHTFYNRWLAPYSTQDTQPFQFLEVGYFRGKGFDAYMDFLPQAEAHSMEISCIEQGPRNEGKWPWGNFAESNPKYQSLKDKDRLHCGDASDYDFLEQIWTTKMKREDAPPLKVVVDDGAHLAEHMAMSLFYWFPKIQPRGILIMEDIEPTDVANKFRTNVLPQVMKDLHYCGAPNFKDDICFPTIHPLLASVHCEMHICVFERNDEPAVEYSKEESMPPKHALNARDCFDKLDKYQDNIT